MTQAPTTLPFKRAILRQINEYNWFPSYNSTPHELQNQLISTRISILLLFISFVLLFVFNATAVTTKKVTITSPPFESYKHLEDQYSETLECPCSKITTEYARFLTINYQLHHMCITDFPLQWEILFAENIYNTGLIYYGDEIRLFGASIFSIIRIFCQMMTTLIHDQLSSLAETILTTRLLMHTQVFRTKFKSVEEQFISLITNQFLITTKNVQDSNNADVIYSALTTNGFFYMSTNPTIPVSKTRRYNNCSCNIRADCKANAVIRDEGVGDIIQTIPGVYIGCYIFNALQSSTLECFFNKSCTDILRSYLDISSDANFSVLDADQLIRFKTNSTFGDILTSLFVERWNWTSTFHGYYNSCQPSECTYTTASKNDAIFIITSVIALFGGLITAIKLITPIIISYARSKIQPPPSLDGTVGPDSTNNGAETTSRLRWIIDKGKQLNLFTTIPPTTDEYDLETQKISTRIFVLLFTITIIILFVYNAAITTMKSISVHKPTFEQYSQLFETYSSVLTCPCTQISTTYGSFIRISFLQHPICSSDLLSEQWFSYIHAVAASQIVSNVDFRTQISQNFLAIQAYCESSKNTIDNALTSFYQRSYLTSALLPSSIVYQEAQDLILQFIASVTKEFNVALSLVRETTQANFLLNMRTTNAYVYVVPNSTYTYVRATRSATCNCSFEYRCSDGARVFDSTATTVIYYVPGMKYGCYTLEALRQSELSCFFNQTCFAQLKHFLSTNITTPISAMNASLLKKFSHNTTFGDMLDSLMVEKWDHGILFKAYYESCDPIECNYNIQSRNSIIHIVTVLLGLIGGLITTYKLLVPYIVMKIRRVTQRGTHRIVDLEDTRPFSVNNYVSTVKRLNLFRSIPPANDEFQLETQRISTRVYIVLMVFSITILFIYNALITVTISSTVSYPTYNQYTQLSFVHIDSLSCPCTHISISHSNIITIDYIKHPVCNSAFVSNQWIQYVGQAYTGQTLYDIDFRVKGAFIFRTISMFCNLTQASIDSSIYDFFNRQYVSALANAYDILRSDLDAAVNEFIKASTAQFLSSMRVIRALTHGNFLLSAFGTNARLYYLEDFDGILTEVRSYNECSCAEDYRCSANVQFFNETDGSVLHTVAGLRVGCYMTEALLQSTLECIFNSDCVYNMTFYLGTGYSLNVNALKENDLSRSASSSTIENLLNNLMIEKWNWTVNHETYYSTCNPNQCTYTIRSKSGIPYIITILIGLAGGLVTSLKLIIPRLVLMIRILIKNSRNLNSVSTA